MPKNPKIMPIIAIPKPLNCSFLILLIAIAPKIMATITIISSTIGRKLKKSLKSPENRLEENAPQMIEIIPNPQIIERIPKTKLAIANLDILLVLSDFNKLLFWVMLSMI